MVAKRATSSQQGRRELGLFLRQDQPWRASRRETALSGVALFVVLMAVWLLNSGHYTPLVIGFGVASSLLVVFLSWRMGIVDREGIPVHLLPRATVYAPWLFKEIFTANVDVAKRVLTPFEPDISPRLFDTGVTQNSDLGRVHLRQLDHPHPGHGLDRRQGLVHHRPRDCRRCGRRPPGRRDGPAGHPARGGGR